MGGPRIVATTMARRRLRTGRSDCTNASPPACAPREARGAAAFEAGFGNGDGGMADVSAVPITPSLTRRFESGARRAGGAWTTRSLGRLSPIRVRRHRATASSNGSKMKSAMTTHCSVDIDFLLTSSFDADRLRVFSQAGIGFPRHCRRPAGPPLSGAAMASRMEESAWMFFIR